MRSLQSLFVLYLIACAFCSLGSSVVHAQQVAPQEASPKDGEPLPDAPRTESQDHTDAPRTESQDHRDPQGTDAEVPPPMLDPPALSSPLVVPDTPPADLLPRLQQSENRARVEELMQEALQRDGSRPSSGDQTLDDVLRVLRQRGSILDDSSLDPQQQDPRLTPAGPDESPQPLQGSLPKTLRRVPSPSVTPQRARAAELLLRTSRVLENLGAIDDNRRKLIDELRREAVKVLTEHNPLIERGTPIK